MLNVVNVKNGIGEKIAEIFLNELQYFVFLNFIFRNMPG